MSRRKPNRPRGIPTWAKHMPGGTEQFEFLRWKAKRTLQRIRRKDRTQRTRRTQHKPRLPHSPAHNTTQP